MRRFALLLLLALAIARPAGARPRWGIVAGPQWSRIGGHSGDDFFTPDRLPFAAGPMLGALTEWSLGPALSIEVEPQLVDQRDVQKYDVQVLPDGPNVWLVSSGHQISIVLPVRATCRPVRGVRLGLGPELRYLARATSSGFVTVRGAGLTRERAQPAAVILEPASSTYDVTHLYQRWAGAAQASIGVSWPMAEHEGRLDVRYSRALTHALRNGPGTRVAEGVQTVLGFAW